MSNLRKTKSPSDPTKDHHMKIAIAALSVLFVGSVVFSALMAIGWSSALDREKARHADTELCYEMALALAVTESERVTEMAENMTDALEAVMAMRGISAQAREMERIGDEHLEAREFISEVMETCA